jgi:putative ABC transport system permease protein
MTQPAPVRWAILLYARVVRWCGGRELVAQRADLLQTFSEACGASSRRGTTALLRWTLAELWDVVGTGLRARLGRQIRISESPERRSRRPPGMRGRAGMTDLRHAIRALLARPADTMLSVVLLAAGLAVSSTIFGVADSLLLHPVPFPEPDRLVQLVSIVPGSRLSTPTLPRDLAPRWLARTDLFTSGGVDMRGSALVTGDGDPELVPASYLSPGLLEALGARPAQGRTFRQNEGQAGTDHVVIISDEVWGKRFGRGPATLGRTLHINDDDYTVIGIMPPEFRFPYERQRLWLPLSLTAPPPTLTTTFVTVTARMAPGLTRGRLTQEVEAVGPAMAAQALKPWHFGASIRFVDQVYLNDSARRSIWLLFGATALLLIMTCSNVANIGMAHVLARTRDTAVCSALGASRGRLIRQALIEQLVVGLLALGVAWPLTASGLHLARTLLPPSFTFASLSVIDLDGRVIALMALLAFLTPVAAGLAPALAGSRGAILDALRVESRSATGTRATRLFRHGLVVTEIACAMVLLVLAALLVRSFVRLQQMDVGFNHHNLVSVDVGFPATHFASGGSQDIYVDRATERIGKLPGVTAITAATGVPPMNGSIAFGSIEVDGGGRPIGDVQTSGYEVHADFFPIVGIPLRAGRAFAADEPANHVIVSESFASLLWPGQTAIGKRFRWTDGPPSFLEVIGVAGTVRESLGAAPEVPQIYQLLGRHIQTPPLFAPKLTAIAGYIRLAVRVSDSRAVIPRIRQALKDADPAILVAGVETVDDQLSRDLDRPRFLLALMIVFAAGGLALAAAGVYGVLACLVSQRIREIGVRLMLGASPRRVGGQVIGQGLGTVGVGIGIGAAIAVAIGRGLSSLLFDVGVFDLWSYAVVALVLVSVGAASAWRPARRAMRVDPMTLLRNE